MLKLSMTQLLQQDCEPKNLVQFKEYFITNAAVRLMQKRHDCSEKYNDHNGNIYFINHVLKAIMRYGYHAHGDGDRWTMVVLDDGEYGFICKHSSRSSNPFAALHKEYFDAISEL